jgi:hypothetical protein
MIGKAKHRWLQSAIAMSMAPLPPLPWQNDNISAEPDHALSSNTLPRDRRANG